MDSLTATPSSSRLYENTTTAASYTGCGPCANLYIVPGMGQWTSAHSSIPALRTTQLFFDPNANTTSTSVQCNTAAISAYPTTGWDAWYSIDDDCNLIAQFVAYHGHTATVTMTESVGHHLLLGTALGADGEITSTDSNGSPTCLTGWGTRLQTPIGLYTHSLTDLGNGEWRLPDLTSYLPNLTAIEQCTKIGVGGYPVALTPAREIILPVSTLPSTQESATSTTEFEENPETTAARPSSTATALPVTTDDSREDDAESTTTARNGESNTSPPPQADPTTAPTQENPDPTSRQQEDEDPPVQQTSPATSRQQSIEIVPVRPSPSATNNDQPIEIVPVQPERTNPPPQPSNNAQPSQVATITNIGAIEPINDNSDAYAVGASTTLSAGGPAATISGTVYSAGPSGSGVLATPADQPDPFASFIAVEVSGQSISADNGGLEDNAYVIGGGSATIIAGEDAATISGTTFSALPSGDGVVAIANGQSSTLPPPTAGGNTAFGPSIAVLGDNENEYIISGSITIHAGAPAATLSGTTYSALPSSAGIQIIANDQTATLNPSSLPDSSTPAAASNKAYTLPSHAATIYPGGSAATLSGTTYSALPSNSGIVVLAPNAEETTLSGAQLSSFLGESPAQTDAYVLDGTTTISASGADVTISGTTYSALPSGAGVRVVADGQTETRGGGSITREDAEATGTGSSSGGSGAGGDGSEDGDEADEDGDGNDEAVESFTGAAGSLRVFRGLGVWATGSVGLAVLCLLLMI